MKPLPLHRIKTVAIMNLQADIKWIISEISKVDDPELITAFKSLLKYRAKQENSDWWDEVPDSVRESAERGREQAKRGELKPHSEVMKKYEKWL